MQFAAAITTKGYQRERWIGSSMLMMEMGYLDALELECDVLVPAALENQITETNAPTRSGRRESVSMQLSIFAPLRWSARSRRWR